MSNLSINDTASQTVNCNDDLVKAVFSGIDKFETPMYFVVGFFSRLISLASIYRESKTEKAYFCQIYVLVAEAAEILFTFLFQLGRTLASSPCGSHPSPTNVLWFQRCYGCMWYCTYLANTLLGASRTNTNLLTLAMTADRAYCVMRPARYAHLPHATLRKVIPFATVIVGVAMNLVASFIFALIDGGYDGLYTQIIVHPKLGFAYTFFTQLGVVFDTGLLVANILANILVCYGFREAMKIRKIVKNDAEMDEQWRNLFKMTFCQSLCNTLGSLSEFVYRTMSSYVTNYTGRMYYVVNCLAAPFNTAFVELLDIAEFCLVMAVSKKFRSMVIVTVKRMFQRQQTQTPVTPIRVG